MKTENLESLIRLVDQWDLELLKVTNETSFLAKDTRQNYAKLKERVEQLNYVAKNILADFKL